MSSVDEQVAVLALVAATRDQWYRTAALIEQSGSALRLVAGDWSGLDPVEMPDAKSLVERVTQEHRTRAAEVLAVQSTLRARLITILDDDYPLNLRQVYNRPPFLFVRGSLLEADERAIAVVGTRTPSTEGMSEAAALAAGLANEGVTVLSGLARGVDAAAHLSALESGGRTVAVLGHGLSRPIYPKENTDLAHRIQQSGALVSQFWPEAPPMKYSFPMRNVVMSGLALGTVVIEAGPTSGAKAQARYALDHGKRLFLIESLVSKQDWAKKAAKNPLTSVVHSADEILQVLTDITRPVEQLTLT